MGVVAARAESRWAAALSLRLSALAAEFTLLISPDAFNLAEPVRVEANGRVVFNGRVEPNTATLFKWAARDNDRTMLFAGELHIKL